MARSCFLLHLILLPVIFLLRNSVDAEAKGRHHNAGLRFIHASCSSTRYPAMCNRYLSRHSPTIGRSQRKLAFAALSSSIHQAHSTYSYVNLVLHSSDKRSRSHAGMAAVKDCVENMREGVYQMRNSLKEMEDGMGRKGSQRFLFHYYNVQTWVSAALTDEWTCLESLSGRTGRSVNSRVRTQIRRRVEKVTRLTSIALALVNKVMPGRV